jgi:hypothetical protein
MAGPEPAKGSDRGSWPAKESGISFFLGLQPNEAPRPSAMTVFLSGISFSFGAIARAPPELTMAPSPARARHRNPPTRAPPEFSGGRAYLEIGSPSGAFRFDHFVF